MIATSCWKVRLPFPRHDRTHYVHVNLRRCRSCGKWFEACTRGVLGLLPYRSHRHVHVDEAERCRGCLRCVGACPEGAIVALGPPRVTSRATEPLSAASPPARPGSARWSGTSRSAGASAS